MTECVIAVDVGNTAVKLCVRRDAEAERRARETSPSEDSGTTLVDHSIRLDRNDWDRSVIDWAGRQRGCHDAQWRIASVHRSAAERLCLAITKAEPAAVVHRVSHRDVPMQLRVDHPDQLGIDRLLAAHAARRRYGEPLVVVDAGSAVTVDWVDRQGDFCGGAILPGLAMQLAALANETDALPQIELQKWGSLDRPGKNTVAAIRLGVLTAIVATIERLAERFSRVTGNEPPEPATLETDRAEATVILTGGDAPLIASLLERPHRLAENLVCRGLLDLPRSALGATSPPDEVD